MLILFDQATPVPIRPFLKGHTVRTAAKQGWSQISNGELLSLAENEGFDLFLTTDKNIRYQQNLAGRKIAILVLGNGQWPELKPHIQLVIDAVDTIAKGGFSELAIPRDLN